MAFIGLVVATPVFFDVALVLLMPLVASVTRRSHRSLLFYALPLLAGIAVAHAFIPPTPGPVAVAGLLGADLGWVIALGLLCGIPATQALQPVGLIILVTGAGGVFGKVLVETGVGEVVADWLADSKLQLVVLAFLIAAAVRIAQGSATVSMVTAAGLVAPVVEASDLSAPGVAAVVIAIASGASVMAHVNDSGFWLVGRYLGMSEQQTLRVWTVAETLLGVTGFLTVLLLTPFL